MNLPVQVLEAVGKHRCPLFSGRRSSGEAVGAGRMGEVSRKWVAVPGEVRYLEEEGTQEAPPRQVHRNTVISAK